MHADTHPRAHDNEPVDVRPELSNVGFAFFQKQSHFGVHVVNDQHQVDQAMDHVSATVQLK